MADLSQLEDSFRQADAAGDTEAAQVLADAIRRERTAGVTEKIADSARTAPTWGGVVTQGAAGLAQGAVTFPAMLQDAGANAPYAMGAPPGISIPMPEDAERPGFPGASMQAIEGLGGRPETQGQRFARAAGIGAGAAPFAPGIGAISGLGGEVGAFIESPKDPSKSIVGNLLGSVGTGAFATALASLRGLIYSSPREVAQNVMADVSPGDFANSQRILRDMNAAGIRGNVSQGMPSPSNLDSKIQDLATKRAGSQTMEVLRGQPSAVSDAVESQIVGLPGRVRPEQEIANAAQEIATIRLEQIRGVAQAAYARALKPGEKASDLGVELLERKLRALAEQHPNTPTQAMLHDVADSLILGKKEIPGTPGSSVYNPATGKIDTTPAIPASVQKQYIDDPLKLKEAVDSVLNNYGPVKLNSPKLVGPPARAAQEARELLKEFYQNETPSIAKAMAAYQKVMATQMDTGKKSVLGRVAQPQGASDTVEASVGRLFHVLDKGRLPDATTSEVLTLERQFRKVPGGPEVFQDAVKTWISRAFDKAIKPTNLEMPENISANLVNKWGVASRPTSQSEGLKDALIALARSKGLKDDAFLGFHKFTEILAATAKRPTSIGEKGGEMAAVARGQGAGAVRGTMASWLYQARESLKQLREGRADRILDDLMNDPEKLAALQALAKLPVMSPAGQRAWGVVMATAVNPSGMESSGINKD